MQRQAPPHYWIASVLVVLSLVLMIGALWQPKSRDTGGWVPVNRQLKATLASLEAPAGGQDSNGKSDTNDKDEAGAVKEGAEKETAAERLAESSSGNKAAEVQNNDAGKSVSDAGKPVKGGADKAAKLPAVSVPATEDAGKIDINRATIEELDTLPGIGAAKAKAIVDDREHNGPFRAVDDLERVKGIGPKMVEQMKDEIVANAVNMR